MKISKRSMLLLAVLLVPTPVLAQFTVFATSTVQDGNLGGLAGGDAVCSTRATAGGLGGTWVAWLSTAATNAETRLTPGSFERVDGVAIAASIADLTDNTIANSISLDEFGAAVPGVPGPWTGTTGAGLVNANTCINWTSNDSGDVGDVGSAVVTGVGWTDNVAGACNTSRPV